MVLNVTGSMPGIVYQLGHGEKGSLVSFCSPIAHPSSDTARALMAAALDQTCGGRCW
jgi:hypothetical protein